MMLGAWLTIMLLLFTLPFLFGIALPQLKLIIALLVILAIYSFVRQYFGDGIITLILTAAAAYYLVYKHFWITTSIWWIYIILSTMAFSAIGWTFIAFAQLFKRRG